MVRKAKAEGKPAVLTRGRFPRAGIVREYLCKALGQLSF